MHMLNLLTREVALSYALLSREVDSRCTSSDGMEGWAARYAELLLEEISVRCYIGVKRLFSCQI